NHSPFPLPQFTQASATSAAELIPALEQSVAKAGSFSARWTMRRWRTRGGRWTATGKVMVLPVGALLRSIMLNHWYHHRGQLSVYLRELDVPVPSIYGPSADENPFAARPS